MRQWGKQSRNEEDAAKSAAAEGSASGTATPAEGEEKTEKLPKKKVAVLIGYNGIGYKGSQQCVFFVFLSFGRQEDADESEPTATLVNRRSRESSSRLSWRRV
jgi:hypothetical protein